MSSVKETMASNEEMYTSSSNAVILPSTELIVHMQTLFSSTIDEMLQEFRVELKVLSQSNSCQDTTQKENEQAQAGYEKIRETPAIPDLPRIMPGYRDSFVNCHSGDRETFPCPTSPQQSDEDCLLTDCNIQLEEKFTTLQLTSVTPISQNCSFSRIEGASHMGLINPKHSNHASLDVPADMTQTSMSRTRETNPVGFTPDTLAKDQFSTEQLAAATVESVEHVSDNLKMCNSHLPVSTILDSTEIVQVLETTSVSI